MSKNVELKSTINLPRTEFAMKADLPRREPRVLDWWSRIDLYRRVREAHAGDPPYVLHDGPPYASGNIHVGHALNKVLKDIVVKSRSMAGHDAPYVPGWDCHGLPIELRVDRELGARKSGMPALEIRRRCREYALKFVAAQRDEFRRLGVLWDAALDDEEERRDAPSRRAIYRTLDRSYEAEIVRQLGRFFAKDAIYNADKPVHWCYSCRTALAEAEVEYEERTDPAVYVRFPVRGLAARIPALAGRDVSLAIWTTTPWTLPANLAVALHPDLDYVAVDVGGEAIVVAEGLLGSVAEALGWDRPAVLARSSGRQLVGEGDAWVGAGAPVERPYVSDGGAGSRPGVLVLGDHVTLDAGTGCVHTAPGHGAEDFGVGQAYGLEAFNPVDDDGRFRPPPAAPAWLAGVHVLEANAKIVEDLRSRGLLLHADRVEHSYPHCWRCKNPVIFRSTPQWFIAMHADGLREKSLGQIRATRWFPATGEGRIAQMIGTRPDWCISRQRTWGVPIPAVICTRCFPDDPRAFVRDAALFEHVAHLFEAEGSDAWFGVPDGAGAHRPYDDAGQRLERLVPPGIACPRCGRRDALAFHEHIVDVWFESGVSHAAVLGRDPALPWPSDLYLEGHDQYRGWFHSSLLVAVNDRGSAPYREVVTHGFTLDGQGRKMSKLLGNVISPMDVVERRGAEILRVWVSMIDFLEDMRLSEETLDRNAEAYRKIRNTFRYLLGNLSDFDPARDRVAYDRLPELDRWALQQLEALRRKLTAAYAKHEYHAVYHGLHGFCGVTLSAFYLDVLKDRLYTHPARGAGRRAAQTVLYRLADALCRLMAPILCFTAEEIWQELERIAGREAWAASSVHAQRFPEPLEAAPDEALLARWERMTRVREEVNKALEEARAAKRIGSSIAARVVLECGDPGLESFLRGFGEELRFVLLTSGVDFGPAGEGAFRSAAIPGLAVDVLPAPGTKCERCWHVTDDVGSVPAWPTVCARCAGHIAEATAGTGPA